MHRTLHHPALVLSCLLALATSALAQQAGTSPVKIFILAGQSNMVGQGNMSPVTTPGTLEYIVANDPDDDYQFLVDGGGNWVVRDDVWITDQNGKRGGLTVGYGSGATTVGPELGFGHTAGGQYENQVLIVKCAWGGKSLAVDFRPPSSGGTTGFYYNETLRLVNDAIANLKTYFPDYNAVGGYQIAGFAWHQGWNDRVTPAYSAEYEVNMANFIRDIRSDLGVPGLPFVIATTGMDGGVAYSQVEQAQLAMANATTHPDFIGNVAVIDTRIAYDGMDFWQPVEYSPADQGYHWNRNAKTYVNIGLALGDAMSTLSPGRCPSRLRAAGGAGGILLTWQNGLDTPNSVRILRDGAEIAAAAPVIPASFLDATALPGVHNYELIFSMPGDPSEPLTVGFDGNIANLEAFRSPGGVGLTWQNTMTTYSGIELRRDGVLIEPSLPGNSTSYTDASPPTSGLVTYSVVPTTGTATPTATQINLDGPPSGNALVYEPFDYVVGGLNLQASDSEVGLEGSWNANSTTLVTAGTLTFGALPVGGAKLSDFTASQNRFGGARGIRASALAENGLLNDGATLWFSLLAGVDEGANRTNSRLAVALAAGPFGGGNGDFFISGGTGVGFYMSAGIPQAAMFPAGAGGPTAATNNSPQYPVGEHGLTVGRITWGATPGATDTIVLFQPGTDLALPGSPISTLTTMVDQTTFDTLTFRRGDRVLLDEIRFGATYQDVIGAGIDTSGDHTPPTPATMSFASAPAAISDSAITMAATPASDTNAVQYHFTCTAGGGHDSGWQDSPDYTDTGLTANTLYSYTVQARDKSVNHNTNTASPAASATTDPADSNPPPTPAFAMPPTATSSSAITMSASPVTDPEGSGVEYYFTCTAGGGHDSGWQSGLTYTDTGLTPNTQYSYTVKARDTAVVPNESAPSAQAFATTLDAPGGPGGAVVYEPFDYDAGSNLNAKTGGTGFDGGWTANTSAMIVSPGRAYGSLPTSGNTIGGLGVNNHFVGARQVSTALTGLLDDGDELWFSVIMGYDGGNATNTTLAFALASNQFTAGNYSYQINETGGTGLGVVMGRFSGVNFKASAAEFRDTSFGTGFSGIVYGNASAGTPFDSAPRLVVGKFTWGATQDTLDIYLPDTAMNLGSVVSTLTVNVDQSTYDTITAERGEKVVMDEIRFGASYEAVIGAGGGDTTPPVWASTWPQVDSVSAAGFTTRAKTDEDGTAYYVVLADGAAAPSAVQVKAGKDSSGSPALESGAIALSANTGHTSAVSGLAPGTAYDVWFVAEDSVPNLQASPVRVNVTTQTLYTAWSGGADFAADANGDGVMNGLAWLLGAASPDVEATGLLPAVSRSGDGLVLNFSCLNAASRGSQVLSVQHSSDLGISDAWAAAVVPETTGAVSGVDFVVTPNGNLNDVEATIPLTEAVAGRLFSRLEASQP